MLVTRSDVTTWTTTNDGAVVVLDLRSSRYLSLNGTAAVLWRRLVDGAEDDDLVTALISEYDIAREVADRDTQVFVEELRVRDLIREAG